ncbi:MAG: PepSY domain-containing protein [Hyphomicrobiales bacterium]|nr:PepSY domain-containing protein [Hyphomicrobiales bacterium]MCP5371849.1 PepSY domain-containing protein [Hyphomicrobiales bacterium]
MHKTTKFAIAAALLVPAGLAAVLVAAPVRADRDGDDRGRPLELRRHDDGRAATPARLPVAEIAKRVEAAGYTDIRKIESDGRDTEVKARDAQGRYVEIKVDSATGEILGVEHD